MHKATYYASVRHKDLGRVITDWTPNSPHYGEAGKISGFVLADWLLYITFPNGAQSQAHYRHVAMGDNSDSQ